MPNLEPTYLRYVYDGLIRGTVHPENASELPDGLVGLYEQAFDSRTSAVVRQKMLERFAIWALVKKEVSASFIAEVLGETEDYIQEFVSTYSSWFNSPESGKYQLYHERLKVYLLQKLSEAEVFALHAKLIIRLEASLTEKQTDEFELYALEYLATHLYIEAMISGDGKRLISLAYSQNNWERQLKVSKAYSWTKNGLKSLMIWASKHNDDEVIECGLQMVDLYHQEQNGASAILGLIEIGDYEMALDRLQFFGDQSIFGKKRRIGLGLLMMQLLLAQKTEKANHCIGKIIQLLNTIDVSGIEFELLIPVSIRKTLCAVLNANSIEKPPFLNDSIGASETNKITEDNNEQGILDQLLLDYSENEEVKAIIRKLSFSPKDELLDNADYFLTYLTQNESIRINKFNKIVLRIAWLLWQHQIIELHQIQAHFKVGLTTKSKEYNTFLAFWIDCAIAKQNWSLASQIIHSCFDMTTKAEAICKVALALPEREQESFISQFIPQIQTDEKVIDLLFSAGSKFQIDSISNNPFYIKGLSLELRSAPIILHESYTSALYFLDNQSDRQIFELLELIKNHISSAANNMNIREFDLLKMLVKSLSVLHQKGFVGVVVHELVQLYKALGEVEDWMEVVNEVYQSVSSHTSSSSIINELAPFIFDLISKELNADLSMRQKKRLIEGNFDLLHAVYLSLAKQKEWHAQLDILQIEHPSSQLDKVSEQVQAIGAADRVKEIKQKIPLVNLQDIYNKTSELKLYTKFHIYEPRIDSRLLKF